MKNIFKIVFIILTVSCLILVTGCNNKQAQKEESTAAYLVSSAEETTTEDNAGKKAGIETTESVEVQDDTFGSTENASIAPAANKEIAIYTLNDVSLEVEAAVALVPENTEITPEVIVDLVTDSLADRSVFIGIDEITTEKDAVIVSFLSNQPPVVQLGGSVEATILDAIAQSLVDNLDEYTKVIFRVEGSEYTSGHFKYGINEVYLDSSNKK
ncbi:MAG: hypothetical protein K0R92_793 [Lachnospiraceae bacterium]|jgi:hypothetical protein|nr:hypothetical protein [Lachnospiraceae bacterium]